MVLIITQEDDRSTDDIIDWLLYYNKPFVRINGDDFNRSDLRYNYSVGNDIDKIASLEGVDFSQITSVFYRRWISFNFSYEKILKSFEDFSAFTLSNIKNNLVTEMRKSYSYLFDYLSLLDTKSLPNLKALYVDKINVLNKAKDLGILIPNTIICNNKIDLVKFKLKYDKIITKPLSEVLVFENISSDKKDQEIFFMRSSIVTNELIDNLESKFFPSLFQQYIEKDIEIRSFFLDGDLYSMAIFSQLHEQTKIDFRNYVEDNPNRTIPFQLPNCLEDKLRKLMLQLDLNTGSFDIILTPDGDFYFLEINPVGQFGMTSIPCNYYIEKKIAKFL